MDDILDGSLTPNNFDDELGDDDEDIDDDDFIDDSPSTLDDDWENIQKIVDKGELFEDFSSVQK